MSQATEPWGRCLVCGMGWSLANGWKRPGDQCCDLSYYGPGSCETAKGPWRLCPGRVISEALYEALMAELGVAHPTDGPAIPVAAVMLKIGPDRRLGLSQGEVAEELRSARPGGFLPAFVRRELLQARPLDETLLDRDRALSWRR